MNRFFKVNFSEAKPKTYSDQEIIYHLEVLPLKRRSPITKKPTWQSKKKLQ
jgi:hypothetical protein